MLFGKKFFLNVENFVIGNFFWRFLLDEDFKIIFSDLKF